jgi:HK97 family phage major capsid protein
MSTSTVEFRGKRQQYLLDARAILDKAELDGNRRLTTEERVAHDEAKRQADLLDAKIKKYEAENDAEREMESRRMNGGLASVRYNKPSAENTLHFRDVTTGREIRALRHGESYRSALGLPESTVDIFKVTAAKITGDKSKLNAEERGIHSEGANTSGGFMVPEYQSPEIFDMSRARMVTSAAGCLVVPMQSETLKLATITSDPTAYWVREGETITESEGTFGSLTLRARACAIYSEASLPLMRDAANIEQIIRDMVTKAIASALDSAVLNGNGAGEQPLGMLHASEVQNYAVGGAFSYSNLIEAKRRCWLRNVEPNAMIMNHGLRAYIAGIYDGEGLPIAGRIPEYDNLNKQWTTALSSTANTCCYVGDFSNVLIGIRNQIEIEVSGLAGDVFKNARVAIRGYLRADVGFARSNDICKLSGITGCTST